MNKILSGERTIVILLIAIALFLNVFVWISKIAQTPFGHTVIPTHNSLSDYAFYVSVIRQGMDGEYSVFDRFSVEDHSGSAIHLLYLLIGWVGAGVGFTSAHVVYHVGRYLLGIVWAATIYWLISVTVKEKWVRIIALAFSLFSASFPPWHMTWWSELDPVIRAAFIPHFTVGHIMMVTAFVSCIKYLQFSKTSNQPAVKSKRSAVALQWVNTWWHMESVSGKRWIVRAFIASWIAAFVHPPSAIQLLMVLPLLVVILRTRKSIEVGFATCVGALSGLLIINGISGVFPWNLPRAFEGWSYALSLKEYLLALGPIVPLSMIGICYMKKNMSFFILFLWIVTSIAMLPLSLLMPFSPIEFIRAHPISNIRFLQVAIWVPLSIYAAVGMFEVWKKVPRLLMWGIGFVIILLTFAGYPATIAEQIGHIYFTNEYQYPDPGYIEGILALQTITAPGERIMSLSLAGMTIPTYINRTVYVGQIVYTPEIDRKLSIAWKFYSGELPICEAYMLLKKNHITAVLYSFDEQNAGNAVKLYPFLQPWNSYGTTQIFTFVDVSPEGCGN